MQTLLFLLAVFAANIIQGITGFAGTLLAMPVGLLLVGLQTSRAVLNVLGFASGLGIGLKNRAAINWRQVLKISLWMGGGMAAGMLLEGLLPTRPLLIAYGIFLIGIALFKLLAPQGGRLPRGVGEALLLAAGVIHALFISGGSLLVVYAALAFPEKREFRATLSAVWVVLNGVMVVRHLAQGYFTQEVLLLAAAALVPMVLGVALGGVLHKRLRQKPFMALTYALLIISGILVLKG